VSPEEGIAALEAEYADNELLKASVASLGSKLGYKGFRRMRRDGACFYRGWLWAVLGLCGGGSVTTPAREVSAILGPGAAEDDTGAGASSSSSALAPAGGAAAASASPVVVPASAPRPSSSSSSSSALPSQQPIVSAPQAVYERLIALVSGSVPRLAAMGMEPMVVEDFAEAFEETLAALPGSDAVSAVEVLSLEAESMYVLTFLRYLASAGVQDHAGTLGPTLSALGAADVQAYRRGSVEATRSEADHVAIASLSAVTGVPVALVSLSGTGVPGVAVFPAGARASEAVVHLLLRPGHYDVLLPSAGTGAALDAL